MQENKKEEIEKQKTMKLSVKEASFASVNLNIAESYIVPYALALNASNFQIGLLRSIYGLLPPVTQLYSSKLMEKYARKKIIVTSVSLQALTWLPIIFLALFFTKGIFISYLPYFLILFYALYGIFGSIAYPAWFSLMGDIVPEEKRGIYFGKRNRVAGIAALIATLTSALILDFFKTKGFVLAGFSILFLVASICRFISALYLKKHYDKKFKQKEIDFSFFQFLRKVGKYNFNFFALFTSMMHFSVMIAGPFFTVFMLRELNFSYATLMFVNLSASLFGLIFMPLWGKFSDRYGRKETILLSSIFISLMPALWLFSQNPIYLLLPSFFSGVGWAGFNLSAFNFVYDSIKPEKRSFCFAYFNILSGIGIFFGSLLGGGILKILPGLNGSKFLSLFLLSSFLRTLTCIIFLPHIKEVRKVKKFKPVILFRRLVPRGLMHELHHHP